MTRQVNRRFAARAASVSCGVKRMRAGRDLNQLVFGDGERYQPRPKSTGGWFAGAVKRAKAPKITPHDLRHTCASIAIFIGERDGVGADART